MSKYDTLWEYIKNNNTAEAAIMLSFEQVGQIAGVAIDHSFLNYKKELEPFGWRVAKISLKKQTVIFERI